MRIEAFALGARRIGMGRPRELPEGDLVVAGFCGAVDPSLRAGDVVVATEVRYGAESRAADPSIASKLTGFRVRTGPIATVDRIAGPRDRAALGDVLAVDMESFWLRDAAVVRVVVDEAGRRLLHPRTLVAGVKALRTLRRVGRALSSA
jgi:4-hydroxy-3-methylbut-2-en-1-yl diphosphate reductase